MSDVPPAPPAPRRISRRTLLAAAGATLAATAAGATYAAALEPFWIETTNTDIPLPGLDPALHGLKIAHVTDLHIDHRTSAAFLTHVADRVNALAPDLVAFTGDLTTHDPRRLEQGARWLQSFHAPVYASLGNHDYDPEGSARPGCTLEMADALSRMLAGSTVTLLRNTATAYSARTAPLPIVGLEDFFTGRLDIATAFAGVGTDHPVLCLSHNPDTWPYVDAPTAGGLILAGHTHGGQIRLPLIGPLLLPIMDRTKDQGLFKLATSQMYVGRGVGHLVRARFLCRPEIAVLTLRRPGYKPTTTTTTTTAPTSQATPPDSAR